MSVQFSEQAPLLHQLVLEVCPCARLCTCCQGYLLQGVLTRGCVCALLMIMIFIGTETLVTRFVNECSWLCVAVARCDSDGDWLLAVCWVRWLAVCVLHGFALVCARAASACPRGMRVGGWLCCRCLTLARVTSNLLLVRVS